MFDGTGSSDDNAVSAYSWSIEAKPEGSESAITPIAEGGTASVVPDTDGQYNIGLVVTDNEEATSEMVTKTITAVPANQPPVAVVSWKTEQVPGQLAADGVPFVTDADYQPTLGQLQIFAHGSHDAEDTGGAADIDFGDGINLAYAWTITKVAGPDQGQEGASIYKQIEGATNPTLEGAIEWGPNNSWVKFTMDAASLNNDDFWNITLSVGDSNNAKTIFNIVFRVIGG